MWLYTSYIILIKFFCIYSKAMACMALGFYRSSQRKDEKGEEEI